MISETTAATIFVCAFVASMGWALKGYLFAPEPAPTHWETDCMEYRGAVLTGRYAHWCAEWDDLPIDETCEEWPCDCGIIDYVDNRRVERKEQEIV